MIDSKCVNTVTVNIPDYLGEISMLKFKLSDLSDIPVKFVPTIMSMTKGILDK